MNQQPQNEQEEALAVQAVTRARRLLGRVRKTCGQRMASVIAVATLNVALDFLSEHESDQWVVEALALAKGRL